MEAPSVAQALSREAAKGLGCSLSNFKVVIKKSPARYWVHVLASAVLPLQDAAGRRLYHNGTWTVGEGCFS